jgi:primary-amine oxidase
MALTAPHAAKAQHPLDSLSAAEYESVVKILEADGFVTDATRFPLISLLEPDKAMVKAFSKGDPLSRKAFAHIKEGATSYKAEIDLVSETVASFEEADGESMVLLEEVFGAVDLALSSQEMVQGLGRRGLTGDDVMCLPLTAGNYGNEIEKNTRLMKVPCYVLPTGSNWYAKPVEGLFAIIDLNSNSVLEVVDTGTVTINEDPWGYTPEEIKERFGSLRGGADTTTDDETVTQSSLLVPEDANYSMDGSVITWDIWRFHYRVDKRPGIILDEIEVYDQMKDIWRDVLYQASLSEVFVPYMDPDVGWYWRTYMDSGEYGFGVFMSPLTPGVDCPTSATYLDSTFHDDFGMPFTLPGTICIFERSIGDPSWRHFELFAQGPDTFIPAEGRPSTEFVVRYAAEVGNYDYLVDYVFHQDGSIKVAVGSTGLDAVKGVASQSMKDATAAEETKYGTLIAPNLVAPNHDHYFNFRLDFDVDGGSNDFKKGNMRPLNISDLDIPRTSMWGVEYEMVESEIAARTKIDPSSPSNFYFVNQNVESGLGHNPGYQLIPDSYAYGLLSLEDFPVKRNAFIDNQLWVTPYDVSRKGSSWSEGTAVSISFDPSNFVRSMLSADANLCRW